MADTMYLRREVGKYVRLQLEIEFGQAFAAVFLALRPGGRHEFDAVAADKSVVASIKSASGLTSGGNMPNGKINDCLTELYYLSLVDAPVRRLVDAPVRRLVLTTPAFFDIFTRRTVGAVSRDIAVVCVPLPADIQANVSYEGPEVRTASISLFSEQARRVSFAPQTRSALGGDARNRTAVARYETVGVAVCPVPL